MADEMVQQIVVRAVQQAYDAWAAEHPSLAAVIDRISLTEQTVESLRDSEQYRQAVAGYHQSRSELELLNKLIDLASPILGAILAG
ncbi:MAG: hypothetical protein SVT52_01675 [Planctomycetota bacterium]|nr:hypothetical protein [Planctomycetota bacterium]